MSREPGRSRAADLARVLAPLAVLALLAVAWKVTPLGELLPLVRERVVALRDLPAAPLVAIAAYVVGGLVVVPVSLLMLATVVAFGPLLGAAYALAGALASAATLFAIGRLLGREPLDRLLGERARRVADRLAAHGVLAVAVLRNLPVAPYSVVNLVAGASPLRFLDYMLGTAIGFVPGLVAIALLGETVDSFLRDPSWGTLGILAGVVAALVGAAVVVGRLLRRRLG